MRLLSVGPNHGGCRSAPREAESHRHGHQQRDGREHLSLPGLPLVVGRVPSRGVTYDIVYKSTFKGALAVCALVFVTQACQTKRAAPTAAEKQTRSTQRDDAASRAAFLAAYKVFVHPRCMNCHPKATPLSKANTVTSMRRTSSAARTAKAFTPSSAPTAVRKPTCRVRTCRRAIRTGTCRRPQ